MDHVQAGLSRGHCRSHAGVSSQWVYKLKDRYNDQGAEGLRDRRADNGAEPLLDAQGLEALRQAAAQMPEDGGLWSGPKVARWMAQLSGAPG